MSFQGHQEPRRDVRNHGSFSQKRPCVSTVLRHQKASSASIAGRVLDERGDDIPDDLRQMILKALAR
jgi:hypothetical protein